MLAPRAPGALPPPLGRVEGDSLEEQVVAYEAACAAVAHGVRADLAKCVREGKALVVEGYHVHPKVLRSQLVECSQLDGAGRVPPIVLAVLLTPAPCATGRPRAEALRASDAVLRAMARELPRTPAQLRSISGVGEKKLADFGALFLAEIARART